MARVRKGVSRKSTVKFDLGDSDDSDGAAIAATPSRRRKTIFQQADDHNSMSATQSVSLMRSRCPTEASQAGDINDDLWAENQDLHDRILDLESRLTEVQADNEELASLCHTNMDSQWKKRCSEKRMSYSITVASLGESERAEELESARTRLLWQKAILAVRLQNSSVKQRISKVKAAGVNEQRQSTFEELQRRLVRSEAERSRMASAFDLERSKLQRSLEDQTLELEKARVGLRDNVVAAEDSRFELLKTSYSLDDDLKMKATPSMTPSGSLANDSPRDSMRGLLGHAVALTKIEQQHGEDIEEMQQYTRSLEAQLADVVLDHEELHALRERVRQLEKMAWAGEAQESQQPWWSMSELGWCAFGRPGAVSPNFADAAPGAAPFKLSGCEQHAAFRLEGATNGSSHSSARSVWDTS